jgi:hypothetical protein
MKKPSVITIIIPIVFILLIVVASIFPRPIIVVVTVFFNAALLFILSSLMGLFNDIDIPKIETRHNLTIEQSIDEIHKLFRMATEQVLIVSGCLNQKIWDNPIIIDDLKNFISLKIEIQILTGRKLGVKLHSSLHDLLLDNVKKGNIKLYIIDQRPNIHFIVVDNSHVRLEKEHGSDERDRQAEIKIFGVGLAGRAKNKFENYRLDSTYITENNIDQLEFVE